MNTRIHFGAQSFCVSCINKNFLYTKYAVCGAIQKLPAKTTTKIYRNLFKMIYMIENVL